MFTYELMNRWVSRNLFSILCFPLRANTNYQTEKNVNLHVSLTKCHYLQTQGYNYVSDRQIIVKTQKQYINNDNLKCMIIFQLRKKIKAVRLINLSMFH